MKAHFSSSGAEMWARVPGWMRRACLVKGSGSAVPFIRMRAFRLFQEGGAVAGRVVDIDRGDLSAGTSW